MNTLDKYCLVRIKPLDSRYISILYNWNLNEKQREYYTCRPVNPLMNLKQYNEFIYNHIKKGIRFYVLKKDDNKNDVYGKITLFDYNQRNHSAEFGYYLPLNFRGNGLGEVMLRLFLKELFNDESLNLYKLYATTASGNVSSIKLLEKFNFHLDGRLRDHYWIGKDIQDQLIYSLLKKEYMADEYHF